MIEYLLTMHIFWLTGTQDIQAICDRTFTINGCYFNNTHTIYLSPHIERNSFTKDFVLYHEIGHHIYWLDRYPQNLFIDYEDVADKFSFWLLLKKGKIPKLLKENYDTVITKEMDTFFSQTCKSECVEYILSIPIPKTLKLRKK